MLFRSSNETRVDTATAASSPNDSTLDTSSLTYSHKEVRILLEEAKLHGWQEGFDEGHKTGKKTGIEEGKEEGYNEGHTAGFDAGYDTRRRLGEKREDEAQKKGK